MASKDVKSHISLVVIGHVDSGKSTTTGHLVYLGGGVPKRVLEKVQAEAVEKGKPTFGFAYIMDTLKAERDRGITIDISLRKFDTTRHTFTIIDAPGHRDFIKNMITGTAQADVAMLVIAASTGEFEAGIGPNGQTREHALLASTLGVKRIIVAVNKMDSAEWSQQRYDEICAVVGDHLARVGFKPNLISYIPISGHKGDNLKERSAMLPWWKGMTLFETLDSLEPPARPVDKPLRIPVQDVYKINGVGTVVAGRIESGKLRRGQTVVAVPSGLSSEVRSIEMHHTDMPEASAGDNVGFNVRIAANQVTKGQVVGDAKEAPPAAVQEFVAQIIVLNHPGEIHVGYTPVVDCHTTHIACRFTELISKIDKKTGVVCEEFPAFLKKGDSGIVRMVPTKALCLEPFADFPALGRFAVRDMQATVAVGIVKSVTKKAGI